MQEKEEKGTSIFKMKEEGKYIGIDEIKKNIIQTDEFSIYDTNEPILFNIGDVMTVMKRKVEHMTDKEINPARIIFIQMKNDKPWPNRKWMCITAITSIDYRGKIDFNL